MCNNFFQCEKILNFTLVQISKIEIKEKNDTSCNDIYIYMFKTSLQITNSAKQAKTNWKHGLF